MSIQFANDNIVQMEREGAPPITAQPEPIPESQGATNSLGPSTEQSVEEPRRLPRIRGPTMIRRTREQFHNRWPYSIGVAEIVFGFLTLTLGVVEAIVAPLVLDKTGRQVIALDNSNVFGVGIWTGIMLIMTGSVAVRASRTKRATTVYRFYLLTAFCLLVYIIAIVLIIVGFSRNWTPNIKQEYESTLYKIHTIMAVTVFIGFLLALVAFVNYYEDVWFGELQLCRRCGKIFCPCVCPQVDHCECLSCDQSITKYSVTADQEYFCKEPKVVQCQRRHNERHCEPEQGTQYSHQDFQLSRSYTFDADLKSKDGAIVL